MMSRQRPTTRNPIRLPAAGAVALALALGAGAVDETAAAKTQFKPSAKLEYNYNDNVFLTSTDTEADSAARLTFELPVERIWRTGSIEFRYAPSYLKYDQYNSLDGGQHRLALELQSRPRREHNLRLAVFGVRTQEGLNTDDPNGSDLFITGRADRDAYGTDFTYRAPLSRRWTWNAGVGAGLRKQENLEPNVPPVADRQDYHGNFGVSRKLSRNADAGVEVEYLHFTLDEPTGKNNESSNLISFTYNHKLSRRLDLSIHVGGFHSRGDQPDSTGQDRDQTGVQGMVDLVRTFRSVRLLFDLAQTPTSGGYEQGTSLNTALGMGIASLQGKLWEWHVRAQIARRDPNDPAVQTSNASILRANVTRHFINVAGVSLGATYRDQRYNGGTAGVGNEDWNSLNVDLGLVWYPWGQQVLRAPGGGQ